MEHALLLQNVSKTYEKFQLDNINLELPKGCIMGFVGENGAGKSTTIKLIMDLIKRDSGEIQILGQDNKGDISQLKEHIGVVMDECCFPENMNWRHIKQVMKRLYKTWDEQKFCSLMEKFSLEEKKIVKEYSRGMKMKLSIAAALSHDSKLLILDEATSGLDPVVRDEILELFLEFIQDEEHSIFMSTHIISDLERISDYIACIHKGRLVFVEQKDELLSKYGILKCGEEDFSKIDKSIVKGVKRNSFGIEALVEKRKVHGNHVIDAASIEEIMLYFIKESKI
ncbi:ABC-2 type transport system ATP-binding protein [Anaeromicropila populeti]|uniref:ABC-2 type transport system ATP-binding protein n=2 Tax=Anaeromicropila populeti TaxID=37658 RepID=A0A1I6J1V0_9FIRM|nr:ABC-2 type transport system ATP-binding protein [Anaeromicropila populeti]